MLSSDLRLNPNGVIAVLNALIVLSPARGANLVLQKDTGADPAAWMASSSLLLNGTARIHRESPLWASAAKCQLSFFFFLCSCAVCYCSHADAIKHIPRPELSAAIEILTAVYMPKRPISSLDTGVRVFQSMDTPSYSSAYLDLRGRHDIVFVMEPLRGLVHPPSQHDTR